MFMHSREGYFGVCFPSCAATREIYTKITLEWADIQFVTRVHALFYFLHDITNPKMTLKTRIFTHHPRVSHARFTLCWWRHSRLAMMSQWPDHCDANTWQVISNSLDTNFIHGDIHDRSGKKNDTIEEVHRNIGGKSNNGLNEIQRMFADTDFEIKTFDDSSHIDIGSMANQRKPYSNSLSVMSIKNRA